MKRLALISLSLLTPALVLAAEPPNVTGIRATRDDGKVTVEWSAVEGSVKNYRVFFSHASILEQGGVYDDFEDAPGDVTSYTLKSIPPVQTLYVSVLAVSDDGTESPLFMEEATVELGGGDAMTNEPMPAEDTPIVAMEAAELRLLTAESLTETGVLLTFTHPLSIPEQYALEAFSIKTASGSPLQIVRYRMEGTRVLIDTVRQEAGRVYQVAVHPSIAGKTTTNATVPQEENAAPLLFTGMLQEGSVPDVSDLRLTSKRDGATNTVEAMWSLPQATIREIQVQQSTDGGRTYGTPMRLDKTAKGLSIRGIPGGTFLLLVRVVGTDGTLSSGVRQSIVLGGTQQTSSRANTQRSSARSSMPGTPVNPGSLPSSGLGLGAVMLASGALAGVRFVRRQNAKKGK